MIQTIFPCSEHRVEPFTEAAGDIRPNLNIVANTEGRFIPP
ncbi:MAG: hypothetical protein ACPHJ3_00575 [Rubripirellula sp.]